MNSLSILNEKVRKGILPLMTHQNTMVLQKLSTATFSSTFMPCFILPISLKISGAKPFIMQSGLRTKPRLKLLGTAPLSRNSSVTNLPLPTFLNGDKKCGFTQPQALNSTLEPYQHTGSAMTSTVLKPIAFTGTVKTRLALSAVLNSLHPLLPFNFLFPAQQLHL